MNEKEIIEEMASDINFACVELSKEQRLEIARVLINLDYCKIPEGSGVLSKKEYVENLCNRFEKGYEKGSKETAKEFFEAVQSKCKELENKYSHLCKSKKEAMQETCRYEGVLAVKRELYEIAKQYGVVEE